MDRRTFLRAGSVLGAAALAGCGLLETRATGNGEAPVPENRPDGVYVPGHVEGMRMSGTGRGGEFAAAAMYSYAHRFWTVTGDTVEQVPIEEGDDIHLMASVWDPETRTVLPEAGLSVEVLQEGSLVSQEVIYPMLSQPMGFHYGGNFGLSGDGTYTVRLSVGGVSTRRTGAFRGRFGEPATVEIPFEYSAETRDAISYEVLDDGGSPGAVEPRSMESLPDSRAPAESELPGRVLGSGRTDDAVLVATALEEPPAGVEGDGSYLAVSARTRYNRTVLPAMGLAATLSRDGETAFEGPLVRTLDPDLGYHYGAVVGGIGAGDELTLSVTTQPQTARHEGYETAFGGLLGGMDDVTLTV
jgi:hypothetical protein